jgi:uncharacterized membrane protein
VICKNVLLVQIHWMDMEMKQAVIVRDAVFAITMMELALVLLVSMVPSANTKLRYTKKQILLFTWHAVRSRIMKTRTGILHVSYKMHNGVF